MSVGCMSRMRSKLIALLSIMSLSLIVFAQPEGASATKPLDGIHGIILLAEAYEPG